MGVMLALELRLFIMGASTPEQMYGVIVCQCAQLSVCLGYPDNKMPCMPVARGTLHTLSTAQLACLCQLQHNLTVEVT